MAPNNPDAAERERGTALFRDMLELTVRLGAPGLTMVPGVDWPHEDHDSSLERAARELGMRAAESRAAGVRFSIEPHVGSVCGTPEDVARLVELAPGLELTLDYTHYVSQGFNENSSSRSSAMPATCTRAVAPRAGSSAPSRTARSTTGVSSTRCARRATTAPSRSSTSGSTGSAATSATTSPRRCSCATG